jgi:hypothetical protein
MNLVIGGAPVGITDQSEPYLNIICTKGADDMSDHDEWISYSHWGMFTLERKSSRRSN